MNYEEWQKMFDKSPARGWRMDRFCNSTADGGQFAGISKTFAIGERFGNNWLYLAFGAKSAATAAELSMDKMGVRSNGQGVLNQISHMTFVVFAWKRMIFCLSCTFPTELSAVYYTFSTELVWLKCTFSTVKKFRPIDKLIPIIYIGAQVSRVWRMPRK